MNQSVNIDRLMSIVSPEWRYIFNKIEKGCIKKIAKKIDYARHFKLTRKSAIFDVLKASPKEQHKWIKLVTKKHNEFMKRKEAEEAFMQEIGRLIYKSDIEEIERWRSYKIEASNVMIEQDTINIIKCKNVTKKRQMIKEAFPGFKERE